MHKRLTTLDVRIREWTNTAQNEVVFIVGTQWTCFRVKKVALKGFMNFLVGNSGNTV